METWHILSEWQNFTAYSSKYCLLPWKPYLSEILTYLPPSSSRSLANKIPLTKGTEESSSSSKVTWNLYRFFRDIKDIIFWKTSKQFRAGLQWGKEKVPYFILKLIFCRKPIIILTYRVTDTSKKVYLAICQGCYH